MDRSDLAGFLRRCRDRLRPLDVGLEPGSRRRTPGLRREEVAMLAGMSVDYYVRLEQARGPQPSTQLLASLARALRLTEDERDHLYLLAGHRPPAGRHGGTHVRPGLLHLLDRLVDTPAKIVSDLGDVLARNAMAAALFGGPGTGNFIWRWFTDPAARELFPARDHPYHSRVHVSDLRAAAARRGADPTVTAHVRRLRAASEEFATLWERHEVAVRHRDRKTFLHPTVGELDLHCEILLTPTDDQRLLIFTAPAGSPAVEQLRLLRVVGVERFASL